MPPGQKSPPAHVRKLHGKTGAIAVAALAILVLVFPAVAQTPARPKLIVIIVVDQMRADYIERFHDRWKGGLRRLVDQGAWLTNAAYPYAETETCPGHATISTGVFPAKSGIVGNTWYDRHSSKTVTCTQNPSVHNIGLDRTTSSGDSAAALLVPGFAEQLRTSVAGSRSVAISFKARAAIMLAGHRADVVLWSDENTGELFTSSAYGAALPDFARNFARANPPSADFSKIWTLSSPAETYKVSRSVEGENPPPGWTTSFPHPFAGGETAGDLATQTKFVQRWRASPFADTWLEHLAEAAIDDMKLGKSSGTDFLGIGFSATDYIGHAFGPDSREIEDQMLQLDKTIGALLAKLDNTVGAGNYVVALSADHGVAPIPEQAKAQGHDAGRVDSSSIVASIEKAIAGKLGPGHYVTQIIGSDLYLAPGIATRADSDGNLRVAIQTAAGIRGEQGVARILPRKPLAGVGADAATVSLLEAMKNDSYPERSGDIWIDLKPNWIFSARTASAWAGGTTHGSHNDYDQRVPIVLFGYGIKPGRYSVSATPADIAPTLAALTGIRVTKTDGRVLSEAVAAPAQPSTR